MIPMCRLKQRCTLRRRALSLVVAASSSRISSSRADVNANNMAEVEVAVQEAVVLEELVRRVVWEELGEEDLYMV